MLTKAMFKVNLEVAIRQQYGEALATDSKEVFHVSYAKPNFKCLAVGKLVHV